VEEAAAATAKWAQEEAKRWLAELEQATGWRLRKTCSMDHTPATKVD